MTNEPVPMDALLEELEESTMIRKSLSELREEMRGVARSEQHPSALPAASLLAALTPEAMERLGVLLREHPSSIRELASDGPNSAERLPPSREGRPEPVAKEVRVNLMTSYGSTDLYAASKRQISTREIQARRLR